jgi:hypothetical protein
MMTYWLDSKNIIRKVDRNSDIRILSDNWTLRTSTNTIIGKPLFEFIANDITRMFVAALIDSVRLFPRTLTKPYRSDSPHAKRFMQMIVHPDVDGLIKVTHELIRSEPLAQKILFKIVQSSNSRVPGDLLSMNKNQFERPYKLIRCSLCNCLQDPNNEHWQDVEHLQSTAQVLEQPVPVIYGVCPSCSASINNILTHDYK